MPFVVAPVAIVGQKGVQGFTVQAELESESTVRPCCSNLVGDSFAMSRARQENGNVSRRYRSICVTLRLIAADSRLPR